MLVSIYIPTKNRLELLKRAIKSVLSQTYHDIELIVVDDGSTDGSREYLAREVEAGTLKAIFHEKSLGACIARNSAISISKGKFITGLDDDDYFLSDRRIEFFVEKWKSCGSSYAGIFDSVKVKTSTGILERHTSESVSYKSLRQSNILGSNVFAPRKHYLDSGLFDPQMPAWQDWDLWLRMSKKFGYFLNINKFTYMVDESHDNERITAKDESKIREAMYLLAQKIEDITVREKSSLILAMYGYPQVNPKMEEILVLLKAFHLKSALKSARKMLI